MRLNKNEINIIKNTIHQALNDVTIYLFGSRMDDTKKGGDIDLYLISKKTNYETKLRLKSKLQDLLHKPVDVVFHSDFNRDIEKEALKGIVL